MVRDRLEEFQQCRKKYPASNNNVSDNDVIINMNELSSQKALIDLLEKIGPQYSKIQALSSEVFKLRKSVHDLSNRKKFANKVLDVKAEARSVFKSIQEITLSVSDEHPLVEHVARVHHMSLVTHFSTANTELMIIQSELHDKHKKYLEKELKITGQTVTEDEIEDLLQRPSIDIFNQNLLQETVEAKQNLLDIQERHEEVLKIEKSIMTVNQLFQDLAMQVKAGGDMIDTIEQHVYNAKERTDLGREQLTRANVYQKKARKKKVIIGLIVLAIVGFIILIVVLSL